jgi:MerR family transcriptional regulator, thiopeptide resistance regulator
MRAVGEVAEVAGVTVRLLHHYDEIGVLSPSARSDAGYRLYSFEDLERLQEILVWRQLGFPLAEITAVDNGTRPKETTMFDGFDHALYEDEVRERWGDTDAYRESARRTATYGEVERAAVSAEAGEINAAFVGLLEAGEPADGVEARAVAERHREHLSRWFYEVSPSFHRSLAEMYISDPRFTANYEKQAAGLAQYVHDAIVANSNVVYG